MPVNPRPRDPALPRRRQNNSCDQCRDGKRRCDVQIRLETATASDGAEVCQLSSCTNCKRWKKHCSVDWVRSREKRKQMTVPRKQQAQVHSKPMGDVFSDMENTPIWYQDGITVLSNDQPIDLSVLEDLSGCYNTGDQPPLPLNSQQSGQLFDFQDNASFQIPVSDVQFDSVLAAQDAEQPWGSEAYPESDGSNDLRSVSMNRWTNARQSDWDAYSDPPAALNEPMNQSQNSIRALQYRAAIHTINPYIERAPSPFSAHLLAEEWNRVSIKKGLLKIYHDSMEGALSCWLTERNCPYSSQVFDGREVWSSNWANRIVTRVCDLDKAYCSAGALSHKDQAQASKVLNTVVMAFAAQWSQTGERSSSRLPTSSGSSSSVYGNMTAEDDIFGRDMQKLLWKQASKALCDASDNKSFRVIFAGIIFSLAQRPVDTNEVLQDLNTGQQDGLASLFKILDLDGAPICLDVALRKLLDHQRSMNDADSNAPGLQGVHKETFGLLCWLAIMFDTLSAAVNRRAFAVCDDDSNFDGPGSPKRASTSSDDLPVDLDGWSDLSEDAGQPRSPSQDIWGDYFLRQTSHAGDIRSQKTRWPCSYNDAASCLADAAPVKVLLFRRVAHLQNLSYRRTSGPEIERALEAVMQVYTHWNSSYGRFIDDCIRHHEELPARIQSWYILLAGHWNLAVLILSDVLQKLDDLHLTVASQRRSREAIDFTKTLRTRAAFAVSDLGRCSQYGDEDLTFSQSPDFHHAVNKAALLTEPWTTVLVRSFGYAGAFLARQLSSSESESVLIADASGARKRLQYCIDALWLLGKKSDMALCAAQVLRQAVH